jgi:hypothetical protein
MLVHPHLAWFFEQNVARDPNDGPLRAGMLQKPIPCGYSGRRV